MSFPVDVERPKLGEGRVVDLLDHYCQGSSFDAMASTFNDLQTLFSRPKFQKRDVIYEFM